MNSFSSIVIGLKAFISSGARLGWCPFGDQKFCYLCTLFYRFDVLVLSSPVNLGIFYTFLENIFIQSHLLSILQLSPNFLIYWWSFKSHVHAFVCTHTHTCIWICMQIYMIYIWYTFFSFWYLKVKR